MKKTNFLRFVIIALLMLGMTTALTAQEVRTFQFNHGKTGIQMIEQTRGNVSIEYTIDEMSLKSFTYNGEEMQTIGIADLSLPNAKGLPNVPSYSRTIAIPQGAQAVLHVVSYEQQVIKNVNVEPSLGVQMENEEPDMNYTKDMKVYSNNALYPAEFASISAPSQIRGVDVVNISINPVRFNPVTKEAIVYHNIELSVEFVGGNGQFGDNRLRSPYFDPILEQNIMNYDALPVIDYEARMQEWLRDGDDGAEYIIVIPNNDGFLEPANRLRDFRMQQGILTQVIRLDEMPATTTAQMKTWFHNAYNTWDIAPVAVLLFGDHNTDMTQGIPAISVSHPYSGTCITDIQYADVTGNDNLPEMVFSRLVAANATEANMMADKQIEYEYTNPNMDPDFYTSPITALGWQTERWFQLCSEVFGGYMRAHGYTPQRINCIYSGTPGSSWSSAQNTSQVTSYFGPSGTNYIPASPQELGGWTGGSPEQVVAAVNNGSFWVQHRDHGLDEGWGEPAVRNQHIDQLTNVGKMPFVMSINCQTGMFNYTGSNGNCFTEKWMRRTYNGQNAGAVGVLSPTEVSYSFVNDAFVWGVYDQFDPNFMPTYPTNTNTPAYAYRGNWRPAFGNVAGKYFLQETSWPYNTDDKDITYIMFTAHCDAFLRIFTQVPETMTVQHQSVQLAGLNTIQITAPEGTTIALTKGEGENLEIVAVAEATGSVQNIEIASQVPPTVLNLTVTGQNYLRYEASIEVIPASGPYVIIDEYALINGATQLNFGENSGFDLVFKNVGNTTAPAGTATLSSESEYVTITNGTADFAAINSNNTLNIANAFEFVVSDEVPNKTNIEFTIIITSGDDVYENHITMKAYAPVFNIGNVHIREIDGNGNGRLDPGETVKLKFPVENRGNADSWTTNATLLLNNIFMQLLSEPTVSVASIPAQETAFIDFEVYIGSAPSGYAAEYTLNVESGVYTDTRDFMSKIGLNVEDFESGEFDPSMWTNASAIPWTISNEQPYEGNYCAKSGAISHSSDTDLILSFDVSENDSIAFYYKVSSESGYDKLFFYIDNVEKNNWSGTVAWTRAQYAVTAGQHTFKWQYHKDGSVSSGTDCAWIDFVILPRDRSLAVNAGLDQAICAGEPAQLAGLAQNQTSMAWTTSGDGTFSDATIMNPIYTPGTQDIANGSVTLTLTAHKNAETLSDDMTLTFRGVPTVELNPSMIAPTACMGVIDITDCFTVTDADMVELTTDGDGTFDGNVYTFGEQDIENGNATITITAIGCGEATASLSVEYIGVPTIMGPVEITACSTDPIELPFAFENNWGSFDEWTTSGTGTFSGEGLDAIYNPSTEDYENGSVVLTALYQDCQGAQYSHEVTVTFREQVSIELLSGIDALACMGVKDMAEMYIAHNADEVELTTNGDGTFAGDVYTFGVQDIENGNVTITITAYGCGEATENILLGYQGVPTVTCIDEYTTCLMDPIAIDATISSNWGTLVGWTTSGTGTINDPTSESIVYTPSAEDFNNGTVVLTMEYQDCQGTSYYHTVTITFASVMTLPMPEGPTEVYNNEAVTTYTVAGSGMFTSYTWTLNPADAGTMVENGNNVTITWNKNHPDTDVLLSVIGHTDGCGDSELSEALTIALTGFGVDEVSAAEINVHPNPTNDVINVSIKNLTDDVQITLYNSIGQVVYTQHESVDNGFSTVINLGGLTNGTYILQVRSDNGVWMQRVIKK